MYTSGIFLLQLVLLLFALFAQAERVMRPKFKDIKIWSDDYYIKHDVVFDENDPHMNITMNVLREYHDVDIHISSNIVHKENANHFINFNTTFSLCRMLSWREQSPVGNLVHSYIREYGKLADGCPVPKGKYYLLKFWLPEDPSTSKLPEVDFDVHFSSYHVDAQKKRTLMTDDHYSGEAIVQEVTNIKRPNMMSLIGG